MAARVETKIMEALFSRLAALVLVPPHPVAWPGVDFVPPSSGGYLRPWLMPAETRQPAVANTGTKIYAGVFQVSVFAREKDGLVAPTEAAGAVKTHFDKGTVVDREGVRVRVEGPPTVEQPLPEAGWTQVPVSIPYVAFA